MRARDLVFHIRCFSCAVCNTPLTKGDQFGMRESKIFCRLHYEIDSQTSSLIPMSCQYQQQFGSSPNGPSSPSDTKMGGFFDSQTHGLPNLPQAPRQKGRPRKRKPKDIEALTANLGKIFFYFLLKRSLGLSYFF